MATRYWVGGSGTWDPAVTTNWSATSGGAGGASAPTSADDVIFNTASSASSYVVSVDGANTYQCLNLTINAPASGTFSFSASGGPSQIPTIAFFGNCTIASTNVSLGGSTSSNGVILKAFGTITQTVTTNNVSFYQFYANGQGTLNLGSDCTCGGFFSIFSGTVNTNNYNITAPAFSCGNTSGVQTKNVTLGTSIITVTGTGNAVNLFAASTTLTLSAASSTLNFTSTSAKTFATNNTYMSFGTIKNGAGALTFGIGSSGLAIDNLTNTVSPSAFVFNSGKTYDIANFNVNGTSGNLVTITASTSGTAATLSKSAAGRVSSSYLSIKDSTATGSALWYAGATSTNVSGNTGWIFTDAPASGGFFLLMNA